MTRKTVRQILPKASREYDARQMDMFIDALNRLIEEVRIPVVSIPNMPTEAALTRLVPGDLYRIGSAVHIVLEGVAYTLSVQATGAVGDVTVITNVATPSGVSGSGTIGSVTTVTNTGTFGSLAATGSVGSVTVVT